MICFEDTSKIRWKELFDFVEVSKNLGRYRIW